jgi:hypothetical protein
MLHYHTIICQGLHMTQLLRHQHYNLGGVDNREYLNISGWLDWVMEVAEFGSTSLAAYVRYYRVSYTEYRPLKFAFIHTWHYHTIICQGLHMTQLLRHQHYNLGGVDNREYLNMHMPCRRIAADARPSPTSK